MKIVTITDIHFGCRGGNINFANAMVNFLKHQFIPYLKQHDIFHVVMAGDFTDSRKSTDYRIVDIVKENFFDPLKKLGIKVHMLCGNHDIFYRNNNSIVSFESLFGDQGPEFIYYNEPKEVELYDGNTDNRELVLMLPWINSNNKERVDSVIDKTRAKYAFGHLEVAGAKMYKHSVSDHGIEREYFKKFTRVISGHYHHRSDYANITYVGAAGYYNWQDYNDARGFAVLETDDNSIEYINNDYSLFTRIPYNDEEDDYNDVDVDGLKDKIVQLVVTNKSNDIMYNDFIKRINDVDTIDFKVVDERSVNTDYTVVEDNDTALTDSAIELYDGYIEQQEELDKEQRERLTKIGNELYTAALAKMRA